MNLTRLCLAGTALLSSLPSSALECKLAHSQTEQVICRTPALTALDAEITQLYGKVRGLTTGNVRKDLIGRQRAWIVRRDKTCSTADVACLSATYERRKDWLTSLIATASTVEGSLRNLDPVVLRGTWQVGPIVDPSGKPLPTDVLHQLADNDLPAPGMIVKGMAGTVCLGQGNCKAVGWTSTTLQHIQGASRVAEDLRLPLSTPVYIGSDGSIRSQFTAIRQADGRLYVLFGICDAGVTNCRNGFVIWKPSSRNAQMIAETGTQ